MKKLRKSLPGLKTTFTSVAVGLVLTALIAGRVGLQELWGLLLALLFLVLITLRNYDPNTFEAHHNPQAYAYRMERDRLFHSLTELTEAAEAHLGVAPWEDIRICAAEARELLDAMTGPAKNRAP